MWGLLAAAASIAKKPFLLITKLLLLLLLLLYCIGCDDGECIKTWFMLIILLEPFLDGGRSCDILQRWWKKIKIIDSLKEMLLLFIHREQNMPHQMNLYDMKKKFVSHSYWKWKTKFFFSPLSSPNLIHIIECVYVLRQWIASTMYYCYVLHMPAFLSLSLL